MDTDQAANGDEHRPHDGAAPLAGSDRTLVAALDRLLAEGYTCDFTATEDGELTCSECGTTSAPEAMQIDERVRFEGASDPDDQAIVLALTCSCGCRGTYVTAYGPTAAAADAKVLRRLATT